MKLVLPEILNIPDKLMPLIYHFAPVPDEVKPDKVYKHALIEGGRGSAKTHSVARLILYLCEVSKYRVFCGRETQSTIDDSVYTVLSDLICKYNLNFNILRSEIRHKVNGSTIKFKGFKEQGRSGIKGLEDVDLLWVDEAEAITKPTLDIIMPTIVRSGRTIFTMNRLIREDPVYVDLTNRDNCLHIHIDYFENKFCPEDMKTEALLCKERSEADYDHIWLGKPLEAGDDYLFSSSLLDKVVEPHGVLSNKQRVMGIDFADAGNDLCVCTILDRVTDEHFEIVKQISWDEKNSMVSIGKIIDLVGRYKPDISILDKGSMGHTVICRLEEVGVHMIPFDGGSNKKCHKDYVNHRAEAYYLMRDLLEQDRLIIHRKSELLKELELIRFMYRSNGKKLLRPKKELKKSPDFADSAAMAVWGLFKYLGTSHSTLLRNNGKVRVKYKSLRRRR